MEEVSKRCRVGGAEPIILENRKLDPQELKDWLERWRSGDCRCVEFPQNACLINPEIFAAIRGTGAEGFVFKKLDPTLIKSLDPTPFDRFKDDYQVDWIELPSDVWREDPSFDAVYFLRKASELVLPKGDLPLTVWQRLTEHQSRSARLESVRLPGVGTTLDSKLYRALADPRHRVGVAFGKRTTNEVTYWSESGELKGIEECELLPESAVSVLTGGRRFRLPTAPLSDGVVKQLVSALLDGNSCLEKIVVPREVDQIDPRIFAALQERTWRRVTLEGVNVEQLEALGEIKATEVDWRDLPFEAGLSEVLLDRLRELLLRTDVLRLDDAHPHKPEREVTAPFAAGLLQKKRFKQVKVNWGRNWLGNGPLYGGGWDFPQISIPGPICNALKKSPPESLRVIDLKGVGSLTGVNVEEVVVKWECGNLFALPEVGQLVKRWRPKTILFVMSKTRHGFVNKCRCNECGQPSARLPRWEHSRRTEKEWMKLLFSKYDPNQKRGMELLRRKASGDLYLGAGTGKPASLRLLRRNQVKPI